MRFRESELTTRLLQFMMHFMKTKISLLIALFMLPIVVLAASGLTNDPPNGRKFKVVLDAGHGGDDGGNSKYGVLEKDVALKTVLAVGKKLEAHENIEVIYTRKRDVFVELNERANIANKAKADLFVSIHCNGFHKESANGNETWVLGLTKSKDNLDVVMMENSVILLEDDYEENYGGFDPRDPSSYATSVLTQEVYMEDSIELAAMIQDNFAQNVRRTNRGVKQNWFVVLLKSYMPSVLVEIGFLSNNNERKYLTSSSGQQQVVESIYDGIMSYIKTRDVNLSQPSNQQAVAKKDNDNTNSDNTLYKVQIAAGQSAIEPESYNFKKLPQITREKEGVIYRYFTGSTTSINDAKDILKQAINKGYKSAFIVVIEDGERRRL